MDHLDTLQCPDMTDHPVLAELRELREQWTVEDEARRRTCGGVEVGPVIVTCPLMTIDVLIEAFEELQRDVAIARQQAVTNLTGWQESNALAAKAVQRLQATELRLVVCIALVWLLIVALWIQ